MIIDKNEIHLFSIAIDDYLNDIDSLFSLLDAHEKSRAKRFKFEKDYRSFVISHGLLRKILAAYSAITPEKIIYDFHEHQKPFLANHAHLKFNLSHSANRALIGITLDDEIGVDIEKIKSITHAELVERFFSTIEVNEYLSLPEPERLSAFYNGWTRKEAFIKALGKGLFQNLKSFSVSLTNDKIIAIEGDSADNWQLHSIMIDKWYKAAICWRGSFKKILLKDELI